jgi:hypothetical protein
VRQTKTAFAMAVLALAWTSLCVAQSAAPSPGLGSVKTVYFWPMHNSLDQYLAEQLSGEQMFQVVVDPKLADAIITERIDAPFLKAMDEVFGPPGGKPGKDDAAGSSTNAGSVEEGLEPPRPANRAMARPEGTVFLVHAASRKVLWSTFIDQKDFKPKDLHRQAQDIVERLKKSAPSHE